MSDTLTLKAEFGNAPVGCEIVATESYWDEYDCKIFYDYNLIEQESVAVHTPWAEWKSVPGFQTALEELDDPTLVVRFTISLGTSFTATGWVRFAEAHKYLTEFLKGIK